MQEFTLKKVVQERKWRSVQRPWSLIKEWTEYSLWAWKQSFTLFIVKPKDVFKERQDSRFLDDITFDFSLLRLLSSYRIYFQVLNFFIFPEGHQEVASDSFCFLSIFWCNLFFVGPVHVSFNSSFVLLGPNNQTVTRTPFPLLTSPSNILFMSGAWWRGNGL